MPYTLYMIKNLGDNPERGFRYIGCTSLKLSRRISNHFSDARRGSTSKIQVAIRTWGRDSFRWWSMGVVPTEENGKECERYLIELFKTNRGRGYNRCTGGQTGGRKRAVTVRGMKFETVKECAAFFNMTPHAVSKANSRGKLDHIGLGLQCGRKPVVWRGVEFESQSALARYLKCTRARIQYALKNGTVDKIEKST